MRETNAVEGLILIEVLLTLPAYIQVALRLCDGEPGGLAPTVQQVRQDFGVSAATAQRALAYLEEEGALVRAGRGALRWTSIADALPLLGRLVDWSRQVCAAPPAGHVKSAPPAADNAPALAVAAAAS